MLYIGAPQELCSGPRLEPSFKKVLRTPRTLKRKAIISFEIFGRCFVGTVEDAETLELVKTVKDNKYKMFAVAYNANYDKYVVGVAGKYDYAVLSPSLAYEKYVNGTDTGYTKQGIDCDDKYIYLLQYKSNVISVHDWSGNYVGTIKLTNVTNEPEAIFHIGDEFYMTSYVSGGKGAVLYKLTLG